MTRFGGTISFWSQWASSPNPLIRLLGNCMLLLLAVGLFAQIAVLLLALPVLAAWLVLEENYGGAVAAGGGGVALLLFGVAVWRD
jgi:membrane-bound ClpP family serine protease